jgi:hypothetical protein
MAKRYGRADFRKDVKQHVETDSDARLRQLTFAVLRKLGRVRISPEDIEALDPRDGVAMATDAATGDIVLSYVTAANEEPGAAPPLLSKLQ